MVKHCILFSLIISYLQLKDRLKKLVTNNYKSLLCDFKVTLLQVRFLLFGRSQLSELVHGIRRRSENKPTEIDFDATPRQNVSNVVFSPYEVIFRSAMPQP